MKSRFSAAILAFFLGVFGINNFYTKQNRKGIADVLISVLLCWTVIAPSVITVLNIVRGCQYLWCNTDEEFNSKFVHYPDNLLSN